jgi:hypothetical protein
LISLHSYRFVRLSWLAVLILAVVVFAAGFNAWYPRLLEICYSSNQVCQQQMRLTPTDVQALYEQGWSVEGYALFNFLLRLFGKLLGVVLGLLIFWRQPVSRMSMVASLFLIVGLETTPADNLALAHPSWWLVTRLLSYIGSLCFGLFFFLFPSGRFISRWTRGIAALWGLIFFFPAFLPGSALNINNWNPALAGSIVFMIFASMLVAQVHRYRRVSTSIERLQTRWVVFGSALSILIFMVAITVVILQEGELESRISPYWVLVTLAFYQVSLLIPVAIAVSILRYRLWDIDLIIRRTLVYSLLTIALGLIYLGVVVFLQKPIGRSDRRAPAGDRDGVSTLAIAALFTPLRRRIQGFIDRRFYRQEVQRRAVSGRFRLACPQRNRPGPAERPIGGCRTSCHAARTHRRVAASAAGSPEGNSLNPSIRKMFL